VISSQSTQADVGLADGTPADKLRRFTIPAWPRTEPPGLNTIPAGEVVYFERKVRPYTSGTMQAGELLRDIRETIARQAEGYFTLNEAAQVLAESRTDLDPLEAIKEFRQAHSDGKLRIHQGGSRFPLYEDEKVRDFWDTVQLNELDAWLRESVGYGFPAHSPAPTPAEAAPAPLPVPVAATAPTVQSTKWRSPSRTKQTVRMNPAAHIISVMGGVRELARLLGIDSSIVSRWQLPKGRRGQDGRIPAEYQGRILAMAQEQGMPITADDVVQR
jgi:hypothetical protein